MLCFAFFASTSGSLSGSQERVTRLLSLESSLGISLLSPIGSEMPALLMCGAQWDGSRGLCCRCFALCQHVSSCASADGSTLSCWIPRLQYCIRSAERDEEASACWCCAVAWVSEVLPLDLTGDL